MNRWPVSSDAGERWCGAARSVLPPRSGPGGACGCWAAARHRQPVVTACGGGGRGSITGVGLPDTDLHRITRYCADRVPAHARDQVRVEHTIRGRSVTIIETRPPWDGVGDWTRRPIAQLRHDGRRWRLWWPDRNTRWHPVDAPAAVTPQPLLEILDDPARAPFW